MAEINNETLNRIADALERIAPLDSDKPSLDGADAFIWYTDPDRLIPIKDISRVDLELLQGIDHVRDILLQNTEQFAKGFAANNALLWGARGMGKSSLVKAIHGKLSELALVEIHREDIPSLPRLLEVIRSSERRCILFCDDLSFDNDDGTYKSLKAVLEGGIEGRPKNVIFYATSNRRHLMPRDMMENERSTAINPSEAIEEKVSLSDRFGLWLGFHSCNQEDYLKMIDGYLDHYKINADRNMVHAQALTWSRTRGARSGRVAFQYLQDLAGRMGVSL
ncbi:MAG: ATP-binding protein [Emcibacteraceae bacterium]|uniref:ATP-binding protein n=1 Tax=Pseudemcibacter sp. TaxID=2943293 RepID=UPI003F697219|nr:ATP-binding protein [Emcibacteraceae bacterium]